MMIGVDLDTSAAQKTIDKLYQRIDRNTLAFELLQWRVIHQGRHYRQWCYPRSGNRNTSSGDQYLQHQPWYPE